MEQTLYDLMDWAGIEELVYSEAANPHRMLGPHVTEQGAFDPGADSNCRGCDGKADQALERRTPWKWLMRPDFLLF